MQDNIKILDKKYTYFLENDDKWIGGTLAAVLKTKTKKSLCLA